MTIHRKRNKNLGLAELIAIALGGMVGGGIFTVLGIAVSIIGNLAPVAIFIGGCIAALAAYSYVKLGLFYKDEGATYSFFKRTYPIYYKILGSNYCSRIFFCLYPATKIIYSIFLLIYDSSSFYDVIVLSE